LILHHVFPKIKLLLSDKNLALACLMSSILVCKKAYKAKQLKLPTMKKAKRALWMKQQTQLQKIEFIRCANGNLLLFHLEKNHR